MKNFIYKMGTGLLAAAVFSTAGVNSLCAKGPGGSVSHVSAVHSSSGTLNLSGNTVGKLSTSEVPVPKRSPHQDPFHLSTSFNESEHVDGSQVDSKLPSQVLSQFNSTMHKPTKINNTTGDHTELTEQQIEKVFNRQARKTKFVTGQSGDTSSPPTPIQGALYASPRTLDSQFALTKTGIKNINGDHTELTDDQTGSGGEAPAGGDISNPPLQSRPSSNFEHDNDYYNLRLDPMHFSGSQSSNGTVTHLKYLLLRR